MKLFVLIFVTINLSLAHDFNNIHRGTDLGGRIIGGQPAEGGQYPFAAAIFTTKEDGRYFYAGALISTKHVLTAAQTVDKYHLQLNIDVLDHFPFFSGVSFVIHLGSNHLNGTDPNRVVATTSDYHVHPEYNKFTLEHDIGILQLHIAILETDYIFPAKFISSSDLQPYVPVITLGWGSTTDSHPEQSELLRFVEVTALSNAECRTIYGPQIKEQMVCVTGDKNEGTCHGDMGAPLFHKVGADFVVVGVAAFISGAGCETGHPSGFTRVYHYENWINEKVQGLIVK